MREQTDPITNPLLHRSSHKSNSLTLEIACVHLSSRFIAVLPGQGPARPAPPSGRVQKLNTERYTARGQGLGLELLVFSQSWRQTEPGRDARRRGAALKIN